MTEKDRNAEFLAIVRMNLGDYRFAHSLSVADSARELAEKYGADEEKAYTAGLLHDVMKDKSPSELLDMIENKYHYPLCDVEKRNHKLRHAIAGALFVERELGIDDRDLLNSIRYHTTGRKNMSLLEKVIFIADFISPDRKYDGVDRMREKAEISLELAMEEGLQFTIRELTDNLEPIHPDSIDAYNEIVLNKEKNRNG